MSIALTFFEESNHKKKDMLLQWVVSNIDYSRLKSGLPVSFYRNASFYLTELPDFSRWPHDFKCRVLSVLVDADMKDDLERAGVINWCRNVRAVIPISVPKDGNCLLHSVGIAVWGILDSGLMLRKLLGLALSVDKGHRFYSRWRCHRQLQMSQVAGQVFEAGPEDLQKEWSEISNCLDPDQSSSAAVPHRFLESIHVYTLANILRRPIIIMTDPTMRTFSGFALQDNDMGGIYLPLEWTWTDTHRTPLLLGYSHNHFSPLLFADHPNQAMAGVTQKKDLAPLVNTQFEQLPVRFLLQGEEPEVGELLRKYLKIKETVSTIGGTVQNILCAELEICNLPDELNVVNDFFRVSYDKYRQEQAFALPQQMSGMMPFQDLPGRLQNAGHQQILSQGTGFQSGHQSAFSHPQRVVSQQLQGGSEYAMGDPALQIPNPCGQGSVRIPPPSFTPRYSFGEHSVSLNPPQEKKCVVPTCKYFGDPDLAMMCSNCFKNYSIRESRQMAMSVMLKTQPSAPMASLQGEEQHYEMSMMAERCKMGCGYRCSTKTYPYCHECAGKRQKQAQKEARVRISQSEGAPHVTPGLWTSSSSAAGSQLPQDVLKPAASHQHVEPSQAKATPPTSPLPASSSAGAPKLSQAPGEASIPAVAGEATSPTQALAAGSRAAPLTPPDDPSDLMLFASGEHTPVATPAAGQVLTPAATHGGERPVFPASQNVATVPTTVPSQSQMLSTGQQTAGFTLDTSKPQSVGGSKETSAWSSAGQQRQDYQVPQTGGSTHEQILTPGGRLPDRQISGTGENRQQASPISSITQQKQQNQQSYMTGQAMLSSGLSEGQLAEAVVGQAQAEPVGPVPKCTCCQDEAVHKNLCGKCYMMKGAGAASSPAVQKMKMMSLNSTSSSAPASMGAQAAGPKPTYTFIGEAAGTFNLPMAQPKSSSLSHIPKDFPPLSASKEVYVQNWLEGLQKAPPLKAPASFEQKRQPMGLPENQEGEPLLSNSDLLASGEQCYSSTIRCIGEGCNNRVAREGQLCDQCRQILRQARQSQGQQQGSRTSVQESLPPMQSLCKTEGCHYCGNPTQLGYCSRCYEQLVNRQKEEERRLQQGQRRVTSSPLPQSVPANIRVPAEFHHVPLPQGRQGELCRALGCNMFGDPKQNNMCYKHYQEQLVQMSSGVQNPPPPQSARYVPPSPMRGTVSIPYAEEVTITPNGATFVTPAGGREILLGELAASGSFPRGEVSVPPPSYPTPESGIGGGVRSQEQSLNETYNRVVNRRLSRCLNPTCTNYGNSSKGGLCNSCANLDQLGEDLIRRTILGEEEIG